MKLQRTANSEQRTSASGGEQWSIATSRSLLGQTAAVAPATFFYLSAVVHGTSATVNGGSAMIYATSAITAATSAMTPEPSAMTPEVAAMGHGRSAMTAEPSAHVPYSNYKQFYAQPKP
ncbi:MAG: hypothetical protein JKX84_03725 [Flavobacteriales bacterium]|nr:hypothetical protein [Flavobacteriales bacterium]